MEYNELMKALGSSLGVDGFEPDEEGHYALNIDDHIVAFSELPESGLLDITSALCTLPPEGAEFLHRVLLTAMAPGASAEDYAFFITREDQMVFLRRSVALSVLDIEGLRKELEDFSNAVDQWSDAVVNFSRALPEINDAREQQQTEDRQFAINSDGFMRI